MGRGRRRALAAVVMVVALAAAACGSDGSDESSAGDEAGSTTTTAPPARCPGTEVGSTPLTVEIAAGGPYSEDQPPDPIGVAAGPDGLVFVNLAFSVYCIVDDTLFEVATPETLPYPGDPEESSYADIAVSADGHPLVADWQTPRVFEIVDGEATVLPGSDDPAIGGSRSIAVGPDGSVYVTGHDRSGSTDVYAIADGEARLHAGGGEYGIAGDGGPATDSYLDEPEGLAVDADGALYIADRNNGRVAVVDPGGTIDTLAGGRYFEDRPDSEDLGGPYAVAVDRDGVVHVLDRDGDPSGLYRVEDDGSTTLVSGDDGDCALSTSSSGEPDRCDLGEVDLGQAYRIAFDADGALWATDWSRLLRSVDGEVEAVVEFELVDD